jgi:hypothetical protein
MMMSPLKSEACNALGIHPMIAVGCPPSMTQDLATARTGAPPATSRRENPWPWIALLVLIQLAVTLPFVFLPGAGNDVDEIKLHYPAVVQIREHWPHLDLIKDCLSPIAPGYHYFLATCSLVTGPSLTAMRLITALVSLFVPISLFIWLRAYLPPRDAFVYALPLTLCCFFLKASCRVVTDNAALLLTLLSVMGIFLLPSRGWRGAVVGVTTSLAIFARQLTASLAAPALAQVVMERFDLFQEPAAGQEAAARSRWLDFLPGLIFRLLPFAVLGYLVHTWHGLVAPQWQKTSMTLSAAPLAYVLAVAGFLGSFFVLSLGPGVVTLRRITDRWVILAAVAGFLVAVISPTNWSASEGRWGGWVWLLVHHLPVPGNRSIIFMVLTPLGAALLCLAARLVWQGGRRKAAVLWVCSVLAWMSSYALGTNIYHHYYEPPLMIFFAVACALVLSRSQGAAFRWWPLLLLLGYDLALDGVEIYGNVILHLGLSDLQG